MRAGIVDPAAGADPVRIAELPEPRVAPGHVKLDVKVVSVDQFWNRTSGPPFVPGSIVAGEVSELGTGADRYAVGQRVIGLCRSGGLAERVVLPEAGLGPFDDHVSYVLATMGALGLHASFTVSDLLASIRSQPVGAVAVDDAGTAFGCVAGGMLRDAGVAAIGIVTDDAAAEVALAAGFANTVVRKDDEPLAVSLLRVTSGTGIAGFVDHRAGTTLEDAWRMLDTGGVFIRCDPLRSALAAPSPTAKRRLNELGARWMVFDGIEVLAGRSREIPERRDAILDGLASGRYAVPVREIPFDAVGSLRPGVDQLSGHVVVTL